MLEFQLSALLIVVGMIVLAVWLASVTSGRKASIALGIVLATVIIGMLARDTFGIGLVDVLRVVLVLALFVAPLAALSLVQEKDVRGDTRRQ
jgi:hypothetical protein